MIFVGATPDSTSGSPKAYALPAGTQAGDIAILFRSHDNTGATITQAPAGATIHPALSSGSSWMAASKVLDAADITAGTFSVTYSANQATPQVLCVWRPSGTGAVAAVAAITRNSANASTSPAPAVTVPAGGGTVVSFHSTSGTLPHTAPATMTKRVELAAAGGFYALSVHSGDFAAGAQGPFVAGSTTSGNGAAWSVVLTESGAAPTQDLAGTATAAATATANLEALQPTAGQLAINAAGFEFATGSQASTMAVVAGRAMDWAVYPQDQVPPSSPLVTGQTSTNAAGRLPNIASAALAQGTTYSLWVRDSITGEVWITRVAAT